MNEQQFTPGTAVEATSSVEVSISCRDLLDKDLFSRSDPMCVVYNKLFGNSQWVELLRTEVIWDCLNPDFVEKVSTLYYFEEEQYLRFEIYDIDNESSSLESHDFLGFAECSLGQIVSAGYNSLTLPLSQSTGNYNQVSRKQCKGTIVLLAEELSKLKEEAIIHIEGLHIGTSFCCISPKVFFTLSKANESGNYTVIYRSESYPGENPIWKPLNLTLNRLCNGDKDRLLQLQCFQEGSNGYHKDLGKLMTTFNKLNESIGLADGAYLTTTLNKPTKGLIIFRKCKVTKLHTFVEYISGGGTQIHCSFAIDFTASNGDPNIPNSLHYFSQVPGMFNPYEQAIQAVGDIVKDYDSTQSFATYGFGARIPPTGIVSHKFAVNFNTTPFCNGIPDVLGAYRNCIRQVQLAGPTNFAPIISDVAKMALQNANGQHYYILLMITDGIINDMPMTKEAIVNASNLPLSIIIVGVGGADFDNMEELDGDTVRLSSNGRYASRDIVQFIPYRDAYSWLATTATPLSHPQQNNSLYAKARLQKEVLAEVPGQLTSFMKSRGLVPLERR